MSLHDPREMTPERLKQGKMKVTKSDLGELKNAKNVAKKRRKLSKLKERKEPRKEPVAAKIVVLINPGK